MKHVRTNTISIILVLLLILLINPFYFYMPTVAVMSILLAVFIIFVLYAGFIWNEQRRDEREEALSAQSSKAAFLAGSGVLLATILFQQITIGTINIFLIIALGVMILVKLYARLIFEKRS